MAAAAAIWVLTLFGEGDDLGSFAKEVVLDAAGIDGGCFDQSRRRLGLMRATLFARHEGATSTEGGSCWRWLGVQRLFGPQERLEHKITRRNARDIGFGVQTQLDQDLPFDGLESGRVGRLTFRLARRRRRRLTRRTLTPRTDSIPILLVLAAHH